jgi:hypothetical protein
LLIHFSSISINLPQILITEHDAEQGRIIIRYIINLIAQEVCE